MGENNVTIMNKLNNAILSFGFDAIFAVIYNVPVTMVPGKTEYRVDGKKKRNNINVNVNINIKWINYIHTDIF